MIAPRAFSQWVDKKLRFEPGSQSDRNDLGRFKSKNESIKPDKIRGFSIKPRGNARPNEQDYLV
jgi:hypothetical protein